VNGAWSAQAAAPQRVDRPDDWPLFRLDQRGVEFPISGVQIKIVR
jgi:hypothetical protein